MARLLTLGETLGVAWTDVGDPLLTATRLTLSVAGAESTVAVGMRRLGHDAAWVGVVGADAVGSRVLRELAAEGVDIRFTRRVHDAATGFMIRDRASSDSVSVTYLRRGSAGTYLAAADVDAAFEAIGHVDVVHVSGVTLCLSRSCREAVERAVDHAQAAGATVSFDVNQRRTLPEASRLREAARALLPRVDVLFAGDDEIGVVSDAADIDAAAIELLRSGPAEVVVKNGDRGAAAYLADGETRSAPAIRVQVADVIGAGDSFTAGYLAARCERRPVAERLARGTRCAARTVAAHGDWQGLPTGVDLERGADRAGTLR